MAGCGTDGACNCVVVGDVGVTVSGSGSGSDPYRISIALPDFTQLLTVQDSESVNLTLLGSGNPGDPFILRADATLALTDLTDVSDTDVPAVGDVPMWTGTEFDFRPPPVAPAGSVNVSHGILGDGTVATPLAIATSGTWGVAPLDTQGPDSLVGLVTYIDSNGQLRTEPGTAGAWDDISGKPATFPPSAHTHTASAITDPQNLNAGRVGGHKITVQTTATAKPTTGNTTGDLLVRY